jgi:hypothetical protein
MEKVPARRFTPSGSVKRDGSSMRMSGHRKSPHTATKPNTASVASEGRTSGSITCHQMRSRPTPSSSATSSSGRGTARKAWRMKKMPNAVHACGSTRPSRLLCSPRARASSYSGMSSSWKGTIIVARIAPKTRARPRKSMRASA